MEPKKGWSLSRNARLSFGLAESYCSDTISLVVGPATADRSMPVQVSAFHRNRHSPRQRDHDDVGCHANRSRLASAYSGGSGTPKDPYQIAWNRVYHQLERMNFEIESAEFESGLLGEGVIRINAQVSEGEKDKGFFSFFSSSSAT